MSAKVPPMMAIQNLRTRQDLHLSRKAWHVVTVGAMALIFHNFPHAVSLFLLILVGGIGITVDLLRQKNAKLNAWVLKVIGPLMRDTEAVAIAGTTWLIVGVLAIVLFFPRPIVLLSLLFLAFADPIASLVGILYGKDKIFGRKSLQGTLAGFAVCTFLSLAFFSSLGIMTDRLLLVSLIAGAIGSLAEAIPLAGLDDNFVMPILSAIGLWVLFMIFGGLPV